MVECSSCHATVKPTQKITPWVVGLLIILFWPGAILYVLTRPRTCPICGTRIQIPRYSAPATAHQEASGPADPEPSSQEHVTPSPRLWGNRPEVDKAQSARNCRNIILAGIAVAFVFVIVVGAVCGIAISALSGGDNSSGTLPAPALQEPTTPDLAELALHSGEFVKWYLGNVQPLCNEYYGRLNCIPIVREVKLGGTCGARVAGQMSWPSDLPDGRIYLVEMRSGQGDFPRYQQISAGSRYNELPDHESLFDCWDLR